MQRDEVLERAPFPAEPMKLLPTDQMFIGDTKKLRIGFTRQDDYDLDEMIGADTRYFDELDPYSLKEFEQDDLAPFAGGRMLTTSRPPLQDWSEGASDRASFITWDLGSE